MHSSAWLDALIVVPLVGAVLALARARWAFLVSAVAMALELVLALVVAALYNNAIPKMGTFDFVSRHVISTPIGLAWDVGLNGISLVLVLLTALVAFLAVVGARVSTREPSFLAWLLVLTAFTMGAFVARDVLEFFIFFEFTLVPSYFLIFDWGGKERARAALKFFIYTFTASAFFFSGLLYLGFAHQHQTGGALTFAYSALSATSLSVGGSIWLFVAFALAFAVKSPVFPFHTWSPLGYAEAPTAGAMDLSGVLAKLGSYGLLVYAVGLFPLALPDVRPWLLTLGVISILYGSFLACATPDLKRFVAYSSLAQMGFITLGIGSGSTIATSGAVLLMFNHGVITAGFFLIIGFLETRRGSYQIADLAGLQRPAPVIAGLFTLVMLASMGLPGLSGFVSEYLILLGTFQTHLWWAAIGATGVLAAAAYLLWAYQRVFHGRAEGPNAEIPDATTSERWSMALVVIAIVLLGVVPQLLLGPIEPSVHQLILHATAAGAGQ